MFLGSLFFSGLIGGALSGIDWVYLTSSVLMGSWGSLMWISQMIYMTRLTQQNRDEIGKYNGIFFGFYGVSGVIGNFLIGILLATQGEEAETLPDDLRQIVLFILLALSLLSAVMFLFTRRVPASVEGKKVLSVQFRILGKTVVNRYMLIWVPYMFAWVFSLAFGFSGFPVMMHVKDVPWAMGIWGIGFFISSFALGKLMDFLPVIVMCVLHATSIGLILIFCAMAKMYHIYELFYLVAFLFGINECFGNIIVITSIMRTLPSLSSGGVSIFRFETALALAFGFVVQGIFEVTWEWYFLWTAISMVISVIIIGVFYQSPVQYVESEEHRTDTEMTESNI
eukprot:TRINITY_DN2850_c0_g1_i1.p1 TRINITY_DN2850_c0_g1~~TRINITY_DN2850_c0_g1_i1.p1  ORF type:complete len:339 (+),score=22.87 TRINITY_DN2850_c0_g1_i1:456-1472(+)